MDRDGVIDVISCDFQKILDTAPHNRLFDVLSHYRITYPFLSRVRDFSTDRK